MGTLVALVREWAPLVLLVVLGWLLRKAIEEAYLRLAERIDAKVPDDLPFGRGAWLDEQLRARGLDERIRVLASTSLGRDDWGAEAPSC